MNLAYPVLKAIAVAEHVTERVWLARLPVTANAQTLHYVATPEIFSPTSR